MREQFEKLPEIAKRLAMGVYWNYSLKIYRQTGGSCRGATFVNGAWYAFQEQQKKIDSMLDHVCGKHEDFK